MCGAKLRKPGAGQRPDYCSRSCSSKAYRSRRAAAVEQQLAAARVAVQPAADRDGPLGEILRLAAAVHGTAVQFVDALDAGLDPAVTAEHFTAALSALHRDLLHQAALTTGRRAAIPAQRARPTALTPPLTLTLGGCEPVLDLALGWQLSGRAADTSAYWILDHGHIVGWVERSPAGGWHAVSDGALLDADERTRPGPWRDHVLAGLRLVPEHT
ncbi:hypothetical protein F7Q99_38115 [Streptomyces kaniharaensis]|uniref:Uncharacterized protein n=1 Tax=Streptomyces kaniharaensis TaxID=212423 RepID=A0A6N7L6N9_9ACTN|nr:hypothetical protein [Streptomyces kaniharaensis]MQS17853.1 hypothetical protein [Streptomyces kaniharaensis]